MFESCINLIICFEVTFMFPHYLLNYIIYLNLSEHIIYLKNYFIKNETFCFVNTNCFIQLFYCV